MNIQHSTPASPDSEATENTSPKEPYRAPHLTVHGQLQRLTLAPGGSIGGPSTLSTVLDNGTGTGNGN